ncbi:hypothetical protein PRZ48_008853 [Zasmidium cellare]|uniref:Uncharacterized protein n=1 Tax=Zasmidium cellare TaxID=395010 RepID=A0ABR0EGP0_ZASCE|nr:hypothetical protein PRZ48_008853 [Zasmidium cellare]
MTSQQAQLDDAVDAITAIMGSLPLNLGQRALNTITNVSHGQNKLHLLGFPAEIRNRIYEHALIEDDAIDVNPTGLPQPALLCTSRQIRTEAIGIYYNSNKFRVLIQSWDGAKFTKFYEIFEKNTTTRNLYANIRLSFHGGPNWANLFRWLKVAHAGEMWTLEWVWDLDDQTKEFATVGALFTTLMHTTRHLPWAEAKQIMFSLRMMLAFVDGAWIMD